MDEPKAENRVSTLSLFEAEEPTVKTDNALTNIFINVFPYAPSIARSLYNKLGRHVVSASELFISLLMKFSPRLNVADVAEGLSNHIEEQSIGFSKQPFLSLSRLKKVQRQTLSRRRPRKVDERRSFKRIMLQFLPQLKLVGFLGGFW